MSESPANGVRGFILVYPDPDTHEQRIVFRVPDAEGGYKDYEFAHHDLEVQIVTNYAALVEDEDGRRITYPNRPRENAPLQEELKVFRENKLQWLADGREGQYVVLKSHFSGGFHPTFSQAKSAGHQYFGLGPFLVKKVEWEEQVLPCDGRGDITAHDSHDRECPKAP